MSAQTEPWPYNLPIFRRAHRATSPNGTVVAEIAEATEVSMSSPTSGTLTLSTGLRLDRCNPSFIWSGDSGYLAVPQFFVRFGLFRRQRLVIVDVTSGLAHASRDAAFYFQPESFSDGSLVATKEPFKSKRHVTWRLPEALVTFAPVSLARM